TGVPAAADGLSAKSSQNPAGAEKAASANNYLSSLNSLSALYQNEVQRLEQKNQQAKELFKDGLISRVEMEASDKALADERAKVDEVAKQIAEANQPRPAPVAQAADGSPLLTASSQSWSTGNSRIDSLIRYNGNQYGVD